MFQIQEQPEMRWVIERSLKVNSVSNTVTSSGQTIIWND
jgi:hypothetical protein